MTDLLTVSEVEKVTPSTEDTIPIVKVTPVVDKNYRGQIRKIHNPQIGSIVAAVDNGFGNGTSYPVVITSVKYKKSNGIATSATYSPILKITDGSVTYNKGISITIKPYHGGNYDRWECQREQKYYTFDKYIEKDDGFLGGK